jgi:hypothetical protein
MKRYVTGAKKVPKVVVVGLFHSSPVVRIGTTGAVGIPVSELRLNGCVERVARKSVVRKGSPQPIVVASLLITEHDLLGHSRIICMAVEAELIVIIVIWCQLSDHEIHALYKKSLIVRAMAV